MNGSLYVTASRISYNTTLCFSKDSQKFTGSFCNDSCYITCLLDVPVAVYKPFKHGHTHTYTYFWLCDIYHSQHNVLTSVFCLEKVANVGYKQPKVPVYIWTTFSVTLLFYHHMKKQLPVPEKMNLFPFHNTRHKGNTFWLKPFFLVYEWANGVSQRFTDVDLSYRLHLL